MPYLLVLFTGRLLSSGDTSAARRESAASSELLSNFDFMVLQDTRHLKKKHVGTSISQGWIDGLTIVEEQRQHKLITSGRRRVPDSTSWFEFDTARP